MTDRIKIGTVMGSNIAPNEEAVIKNLHRLLKSKVKFDLIVNADCERDIKDLSIYRREKSSFVFSKPKRLRETIETFWSTYSYVKEENPDVLFHITKPFLYGFIAALTGKLCQIPSVVRVGGEVFYWYRHFTGLRKVQYFTTEYFPSFLAFRWANSVVSIGENLLEMLAKSHISREKITIIRQPVNRDLFFPSKDKEKLRRKLNIPLNKRVILFVGRLDKLEGVGYFPEIVKQATKKRDDLLFVLVGRPNPKYQDKILSKYEPYVRIEGKVPHSKIHKYYKASDLLIHPSPTEGGLPNTVLEAIACDLPVVGTPVGEMEEILPETYETARGFANFISRGEWETVDLPSEFENSTIQKEYRKIFEDLLDN